MFTDISTDVSHEFSQYMPNWANICDGVAYKLEVRKAKRREGYALDSGHEASKSRQRIANMTPEQKRKYKRRIAKWRKEHAEERREYQRKRYMALRDDYLKKANDYYQRVREDPDRYQAYIARQREWHRKNSEAHNKRRREIREQKMAKRGLPKRKRIHVKLHGKVKTLYAWARYYGMNKSTVYNRITNGWRIIDALTIPVGCRP